MRTNIVELTKKHNIETDVNKRWENGIDHHPKSMELFKSIMDIDFELCDDYFCWKCGGDGDNGESFMYQLDIYFETLDKENEKNKLTEPIEPQIRIIPESRG